jgi:hypothetical protein
VSGGDGPRGSLSLDSEAGIQLLSRDGEVHLTAGGAAGVLRLRAGTRH